MSEEVVLLTKKGTVRKRKPKKANVYFTQDTEDAILEYLKSRSPKKRKADNKSGEASMEKGSKSTE